MTLEIGKYYRDRQGHAWTVLDIHVGQSGTRVTVARWDAAVYRTRLYRWDGRYDNVVEDPWDLVEECKPVAIEPDDAPERLRRKANQEWEMAGLARQDGDTKAATQHTLSARWYERQLSERQ
jgi:hypothetical protein